MTVTYKPPYLLRRDSGRKAFFDHAEVAKTLRGKKGTFSHPNWNVVYQMQSISGENSLVKTLRLQYLEALCFNFNFLKA